MKTTHEKLIVFAIVGLIVMIIVDILFGVGLFEKNLPFVRYGILVVLVGCLGVIHSRGKNREGKD